MIDVRTVVSVGAAAAIVDAIHTTLRACVETARAWPGVLRVEIESPPRAVGPDVHFCLRTTGAPADALLDRLAQEHVDHQVRAAFASVGDPDGLPTGRYAFNEERAGRTAVEPPVPEPPSSTSAATVPSEVTPDGAEGSGTTLTREPTGPPTTPPLPAPSPPPSPASERAAPGSSLSDAKGALVLQGAHATLTLNITTRMGEPALRGFGADAKFCDPNWQFTLERTASGWSLTPNPGAPNETLHNGRAVTTAASLREGDVIGVGREAKGIVKMPLRVRFASVTP